MNTSMSILKKHVGEAIRDLRNHRYERSESGVHIGRTQAFCASGIYNVRVNKGPWSEDIPNLLPTEGLIYLLNLLGDHIAIATCYLALYATALTPIAAHTGAGFPATYGEITSGSEGYDEATRVEWITATAAGTAILNNYASPATFTIDTASTLAVEGVGLLTTATKGDTTGKLVSATRFPSTRTLSDTDEFDVKYQIALTSS